MKVSLNKYKNKHGNLDDNNRRRAQYSLAYTRQKYGGNQTIGRKLIITDECMGVSQLLEARTRATPQV